VIRGNADVEDQRFIASRSHLDTVRSTLDVQPLEHAVELIDDAGVIAVDVYLGLSRPDLQPQRAFLGEASAVPGRGLVRIIRVAPVPG
jgi:hypothetical protein